MISRSEYSEIQYVVDNGYAPAADRSIRYDDPQIGVNWDTEHIVLSEKDRNAPFLQDCDCNFTYE